MNVANACAVAIANALRCGAQTQRVSFERSCGSNERPRVVRRSSDHVQRYETRSPIPDVALNLLQKLVDRELHSPRSTPAAVLPAPLVQAVRIAARCLAAAGGFPHPRIPGPGFA